MAHKGYHAEYQIAKRVKGKRIGGPGNMDVDAGWLSIEVKQLGRVPHWIGYPLIQAARLANTGQLPVVRLHEKGGRYDDDIYCIHAAAFHEWFGDAKEGLIVWNSDVDD